jgi:hypothetical protein
MSNMKDYAMWLEHNGYATSESEDADLINEYKNDVDWHMPNPPSHSRMVKLDDGDYIIEDDGDGYVIDDGDYDGPNDMGWTPEENWFRPDGGLTGEAWEFLATTDSEGDFI